MSILRHEVAEMAAFQLLDASEQPIFENDDPAKPSRVLLYSPGSKQFAAAQTARNNRIIDRMKGKGKSNLTPEEQIKEKADYLADCTHSWENVDLDGKTGRDLSIAIYSRLSLGFIADQNAKRLGDWKDFSKDSQTT